jgi:hypothetical protein
MYTGWTQTDYKKWLQHVQRMDTNRLPKVATACTEDGHKQTTKIGYNMYRGWTQTDYQNKHYNIKQKDEGTWDDRGRDGGTNFILGIKEQETRLTLQEHDDDDDDYVYTLLCKVMESE